jgi:hypothetical protein
MQNESSFTIMQLQIKDSTIFNKTDSKSYRTISINLFIHFL